MQIILLTLIAVIGTKAISRTENINDAEVQTPLGIIRGQYLQSENGRNYAAFEGIPYAKPPIQKYRFREARPIRSYHGTVEARFQRICIQYNHYEHGVIGEEDCLYLNVYSPQINKNSSLPVIIFIHGGGFMFGSGYVYGPKFIMDRDIVYATFNYRLGPLGFLSTEDSIVPGNNGLKDQVLAIKWIKENIIYFGGDPSQITLTGMSAGGSSVHLHYLSPLSTGLFTRGFSLSGTAINHWVLQKNAREKALKLSSILGCPTNDIKSMINCLSYVPVKSIVETIPQFYGYLSNPFSPFGPVVEPANTVNAFLSTHPYELLIQGKIQDLPWITSLVQSEGLYPGAEFWPNPNTLPELESRWNELAPHILDFNYTLDSSQHAQVSSQIKEKYFKGKPISKSTFRNLIKLLSDRIFISAAQTSAKLQANINTSPVYFYLFLYRGAHSKSEALSQSNENFGASHGDDAVYVLSSDVNVTSTESDKKMTKALLELWSSYSIDGIPKLLNSTWDAVSKNITDPLCYVQIHASNSFLVHYRDFCNIEFWSNLPFKENQNLIRNVKDEL